MQQSKTLILSTNMVKEIRNSVPCFFGLCSSIVKRLFDFRLSGVNQQVIDLTKSHMNVNHLNYIVKQILPDYFTKNTLIELVVYSFCTKIFELDHFFTDCDDCLINGNHGYLEYPGVCEKYIQVYPDANGNKASTIRKCFGGLFWDNSAMVCRRPQEVECAYGKQQWNSI